jgi:S1-C subfamily serine protease
MNSGKKVLLLIILISAGIFGVSSAYYFFESDLIGETGSSTVYIENGVSGVVTVTDPLLNKTVDIDVDYYALGSGSGFIVTSDGYIITAFHVISDPQALENNEKLVKMDDSIIQRYVEQAAVSDYLSHYNPQLGYRLLQNSTGANRGSMQLEGNSAVLTSLFIENNLLKTKSSEQVIKVKFPAHFGLYSKNSFNTKLIDVGDSESDVDVALLKAEPVSKLSALGISSQQPPIGENVLIYGYPVNSGVQYNNNQTSVTASKTTGSLKAKTTNSRGTVYYETSAATIAGYSGGPVLNSKNDVIGILIYGTSTSKRSRQQNALNDSYFLSSKYITAICKKNNVSITLAS